MNKNKSVRFAACVAFALAASATLPAAELTHRWSFNGDNSDSAGGADATKCGTYVSLYGGKVHMGTGGASTATTPTRPPSARLPRSAPAADR